MLLIAISSLVVLLLSVALSVSLLQLQGQANVMWGRVSRVCMCVWGGCARVRGAKKTPKLFYIYFFI